MGKPTICIGENKGWQFWIKKVEELYYLCSENKGDDRLRSYCEADLHLCFRICKMLVFFLKKRLNYQCLLILSEFSMLMHPCN